MLLCIVYAMLFVDSVDIHREKLYGWLLKKVMGRNVLEILMPSVDSVNIYSILWYGSKALSLSFLKLFRIENQLNIKEVMRTNVYVICIDCVDIHSIECIRNMYAWCRQCRHI